MLKKRNIIIIILILLVLGLTGYIVYDKVLNKEENINNQENNNENIVLPEWVNYLLKQNITEIKYYPGGMDEDSKCEPAKTISKEALTKILTKMTTSNLKKTNMAGLGGVCVSSITIKYNNNELNIFANQVLDAEYTDSEIISLIEQEEYTLDKYDDADNNWYYIYNWDTTYIDTIIK